MIVTCKGKKKNIRYKLVTLSIVGEIKHVNLMVVLGMGVQVAIPEVEKLQIKELSHYLQHGERIAGRRKD